MNKSNQSIPKEKTLRLRSSNTFYKNRKQMPLQHEVYDIKGLNIVFKKGLSASMSKYSKKERPPRKKTWSLPSKHRRARTTRQKNKICGELLYDNAKVGRVQGRQRFLKGRLRAGTDRNDAYEKVYAFG